MTQDFNPYQIYALQKIADYRTIFRVDQHHFTLKSKPVSGSKLTIAHYIDSFIELFCENNFANTDYTVIQNEPFNFLNAQEWINQMDIGTILTCLTYAIWTDKSYQGYFLRKINDHTAEKMLTRLHEILQKEYRTSKLSRTKVTILDSGTNSKKVGTDH